MAESRVKDMLNTFPQGKLCMNNNDAVNSVLLTNNFNIRFWNPVYEILLLKYYHIKEVHD